jgi:hypothetical protein
VHSVPTIYPFRYFAIDGGLVSYGIDAVDVYQRAARSTDRLDRHNLTVRTQTAYDPIL